MSPKGDAAILAIMGGPKARPKPKPAVRSPFAKSVPKELDINIGSPEEDGELGGEEGDRAMIVADLESALRTRDADALYDAIKAIVVSESGDGVEEEEAGEELE